MNNEKILDLARRSVMEDAATSDVPNGPDEDFEKLQRRVAAVKFAEAVDKMSGNNVPFDSEIMKLNQKWIAGEIDGEELLEAVRDKWRKRKQKK